MSTRKFHIAIIGEGYQLQMASHYLAQSLTNSNVLITPVQVGTSCEPVCLSHAFTPFDNALKAILSDNPKNPPKTYRALTLKNSEQDKGFKFNFGTYGVLSSGVNFSQAYEVAQNTNPNLPAYDQFLTQNKSTFGITYDREQARICLQRENNKNDIYSIITNSVTCKSEGGQITQISTEEGQLIKADLYIDCSKKQILMRELQSPQIVPSELIPNFSCSITHEYKTNNAFSDILIESGAVYCHQSTGAQESTRKYTFSPSSQKNRASFRFANPWTGNCVSAGNGYCDLPELLICKDRILEIQLHTLAQFLPITKGANSASAHYRMYSERAFNDSLDSTNLLLLSSNLAQKATPTNELRINLFESSGAFHQQESLLISNSCWAGLMHAGGLRPRAVNAIAKSRPSDQLAEAVKKLALGA